MFTSYSLVLHPGLRRPGHRDGQEPHPEAVFDGLECARAYHQE
jgi:hypothetical protein